MNEYTLKDLAEGGKALAESYLKGDDPCLGVPRDEIMLIQKDFAVHRPYIPLQVSHIGLKDQERTGRC